MSSETLVAVAVVFYVADVFLGMLLAYKIGKGELK